MRTCACAVILIALLAPTTIFAAAAGPQVVVYFDSLGTMRQKDSPGPGALDSVYVYGEGFPAPFLAGVQYKIDYGPSLTWLGDKGLPGAVIGNSEAGIAMGFGARPRPGSRFLIHRAIVLWTTDCGAPNVDGPTVVPHPSLGPVSATVFPGQQAIRGTGARSQTCQNVEMDIRADACPNPMNIALWDMTNGNRNKGVLPVWVLGSATVNVDDVDVSTVFLEGVAPLDFGASSGRDEGVADGASDCVCDPLGGDSFNDLKLKFRSVDIAAAIPTPNINDVIVLTLTGTYFDGTPFEATDCVTIVGNPSPNALPFGDADDADLSPPNPNPFNPVTSFSYRVPSTQHVRLTVYDVKGRLVQELVNGVVSEGEYIVEWNAGTLASGVYFYRLQVNGRNLVRRATLLK
ncbi:MAG: T9SS type A sorting domain-containing protein [Candidatus Krumholzibacteria bacterium]|nr:T9SS type A sorting domain-containing protein [Candidatus Krumholzibacteria bacterium]